MVTCRKCGRPRNERYMQQAVFRNFAGDEPAGIWQCASSQSCKKARKVCSKCGHLAWDHGKYVDKWFDGRPGHYCLVNMGMGDPCGCAEIFKI